MFAYLIKNLISRKLKHCWGYCGDTCSRFSHSL